MLLCYIIACVMVCSYGVYIVVCWCCVDMWYVGVCACVAQCITLCYYGIYDGVSCGVVGCMPYVVLCCLVLHDDVYDCCMICHVVLHCITMCILLCFDVLRCTVGCCRQRVLLWVALCGGAY